jgi:Mrr N-terminal domain
MVKKPNRVTEAAVGIEMMRVLADCKDGQATVRTIKKRLPDYLELSEEDHEPSDTRKGEEMWEQQVRNQKSHDKSPGNILHEGFVERPKIGTYRLTDAGWLHLKNKKLI